MVHDSSTKAIEWFKANRKTAAILALKVFFSAAIIAGCFLAVDLSELPSVLARIDLPWFSAALVLSILGSIVLPAMVTAVALNTERIRLTLQDIITINFVTRFYILIFPRAVSTGIRWLRYKEGGRGEDALALMIYERILQLLTMIVIAVAAVLSDRDVLGSYFLPVFSSMLVITLVLIAAFAPFFVPRFTNFLKSYIQNAPKFLPTYVFERIKKLLHAVEMFDGIERRDNVHIVLISTLSCAAFIFAAYIVALAVDVPVSLTALAWVRPIVFLVTMLPFTVAGIGVREAGFIGLLHLYGVPPAESAALAIALLAIQLAVGLMGAIAELWRWGIRPALTRLLGEKYDHRAYERTRLAGESFVAQLDRSQKAHMISAVLEDYLGKPLTGFQTLDIGCGNGDISRHLARYNDHYAVDIEDLRSQDGAIFRFSLVNSERLPFEDCRFDVVISHHVIEHMVDQDLHLQEVYRVLKPGGISYLATPNKTSPIMRGHAGNNRVLRYGEMAPLFRRHGFGVTEYGAQLVKHPDRFHGALRFGRFLPSMVIMLLRPLFPSQVFVISKPDMRGSSSSAGISVADHI